MTESHRSKLSIAALEFHDRIKSMEETIKMNPKIMRKVVYKASELKTLGVLPGRNPGAQITEAQLNNDHAGGRRLSA